jgi:hypothetical protein
VPVKRRARPRYGRCAATWGANHQLPLFLLWVARSLRGGGNLRNEAGEMTTAIEVGPGTLIKLAATTVLMITAVVAAWTANRR